MRILLIATLLVAGCGGGGGDKEPETCARSAECSTETPYCSGQACTATCAADTECPGFGQTAAQQFCETGACVACRMSMMDCSGATPVCAMGACRRCERNDECASGACAADGSCVDESSILYVAPNGSTTSICTRTDQCTLARAVAITPARQFIVLTTGTHSLTGTLTVGGTRSFIGSGTSLPVVTNAATGPIFKMALDAKVTFDHLQVSGAKNSATGGDGAGILIPTDTNVTVRVTRGRFSDNASAGIDGRKCTIEISDSTFLKTARAIAVVDSKATIDRSIFTENTTALFLDAGLYVLRNNMIYRNQQGVSLFADDGSQVEFNTIVDNMQGFSCQAFVPDGTEIKFPNNLLARNASAVSLLKCAFTNSIMTGTDINSLKFKSPDVAPFDYHIQAGSSAIDLASTTGTMVDFDGEPRPSGSANDVGADELH